MWAVDAELAKAIARELLKGLRPQGSKLDEPVREPPFKPEPVPKRETYLESLRRKARDDCRAGRAVSANVSPKPKRPPSRPGSQAKYWNGLWSWWG